MALWKLARQYTLADNFFMGAFGGSFLNHQYLVCACVPEYPNADHVAGQGPRSRAVDSTPTAGSCAWRRRPARRAARSPDRRATCATAR